MTYPLVAEQLPVLADLARVPTGIPVALLLRHSIRGPIPRTSRGDEILLTPEGHRLALELGRLMGPRFVSVATSPVQRCRETAERLLDGAGQDLPQRVDRTLGRPGIVMGNEDIVWSTFHREGIHPTMVRYIGGEPLPGFPALRATALQLALWLAGSVAGGPPGIHLFSSHDLMIMGLLSGLEQRPLAGERWPDFLDGVYTWTEQDAVRLLYRGELLHLPVDDALAELTQP